MLSLFFAIFGSIGIFLNWPIINKGFFELLTKPWDETYLFDALNQLSSGFSRPDGCIIIGISLLILFTAFIRTTKCLLNTRIILLAVISSIISAELFTVIQLGYSFHVYTGLLYSTIFYFLAFISAIFRFGSMKSFNSTFMGKPMTESKVFSQTFSQVIDQVAKSPTIRMIAEDDINSQWSKGIQREFSSFEIKVGRNEDWADMLIGADWGMVSGKHGIIRIIGNTMIYEPVTSHYAFGVNGNPFTAPKEIPNQSRLSLVSGMGPRLKIDYDFQKKSVMHPRTMLRVGEIARDEFKNLQTTFKILIIMVILGLPLLWGFSALQKKEMGDYVNQIKRQNTEFTLDLKEKIGRLLQLNQESRKNQQEINRLKSRIKQLNESGGYEYDEIQASRKKINKLRNKGAPGKINQEIKKIAKIIDIKMSSQRISVYYPYISFSGNELMKTGTALFIKNQRGKILIATEKSKVLESAGNRNTTTFFFIYPDSWQAFHNYSRKINSRGVSVAGLKKEMIKNQSRYNLLVIDGKTWKRNSLEYDGNTIVT
ncbi:MAG: hypothetical protein KAT17_09880, partial [Candidatus Aminicenantes bacterium]|nr:hypothetical protein [Candidatus Aminicenantes bacterium]